MAASGPGTANAMPVKGSVRAAFSRAFAGRVFQLTRRGTHTVRGNGVHERLKRGFPAWHAS
jgi:hypothetical protein